MTITAICLGCGHKSTDLDAHDEHQATCTGQKSRKRLGMTDVECPTCGAQPGTPCVSDTGGITDPHFRRAARWQNGAAARSMTTVFEAVIR